MSSFTEECRFMSTWWKTSTPLSWASVHWLVQCTLECQWVTQCTLGYHWATHRILVGYTGTPLEKLSWNSPHSNATGETLTFAAYTGTPLEGLWQPTQAPTHIINKYSLLMHCIKIKSPAKFLLNEQYVFVGGNISFLCVLSCSSEEA